MANRRPADEFACIAVGLSFTVPPTNVESLPAARRAASLAVPVLADLATVVFIKPRGRGVMRYRRLGRSDLTLSALGFGASPFGNVFAVTDLRECIRATHLAVDLGINFFDVSPYYGETLAEERLGQALVGKRGLIVLATKCGRYGANKFDFSAQGVTAGLEASLRRLRTDHVDLLQVHDVEFAEVAQVVAETLPALHHLQKQGKTRYVGITGYSLKTLARIARAFPVDSILTYCRSNLLITDMDEALVPLAEERGIGLINASPLHMGLLTEEGAPAWHPAPPSVHAAARRAKAAAEARGFKLPELALRFCLAHPYVASTLVGMATQAQVAENVNALDVAVDNELFAEVLAAIGPGRNIVWPSGRLENHD
jgi:L-galactose dehydrogenase